MIDDYKTENVWLMKGDCLERMKEIESGSVGMILTDPPYSITACKWDSIIPLEPMWEQLKRIIKPNGAIVMTSSQPFTSALVLSNPRMFKYQWVWQKDAGTGFGNANRQPLRDHEDIPVFYHKQPTYHPQFGVGTPYKTVSKGGNHTGGVYANGGLNPIETINEGRRFPKTVLKFNRDRNKIHPTQKPVALMEYLIKTYTNEGETVLDFTMGSGTTGVACKNTNRNFIGIELDDHYFEIGKNRILAD